MTENNTSRLIGTVVAAAAVSLVVAGIVAVGVVGLFLRKRGE